MCFSTGRKANSFGKKQLWTFYLTFDFKKSTLFSGMSVFSSPFALTVWVSLLTLAHQRHSPLRTECLMLMMSRGQQDRKIEDRGGRLPHVYLAVVYSLVLIVIAYNIKWSQVSEHRVFGFVFFVQGSIFCQLRWLLQRINYLLCVNWVSLIH